MSITIYIRETDSLGRKVLRSVRIANTKLAKTLLPTLENSVVEVTGAEWYQLPKDVDAAVNANLEGINDFLAEVNNDR
jgi:hypothetical protein